MKIDKNNSSFRYKNLINENKTLQYITNFLSTRHNNKEFSELIDNFGLINKVLFAKPYNWVRSRPIIAPKKFLRTSDFVFGAAAIANGPKFEQEIYGKITNLKPKYLTMTSAVFNAAIYIGVGLNIDDKAVDTISSINKHVLNYVGMDLSTDAYYYGLITYGLICAGRFTLAAKNNRGYQDLSLKKTIMNAPSNYKVIKAHVNNIDLTQMSKKYTTRYKNKN